MTARDVLLKNCHGSFIPWNCIHRIQKSSCIYRQAVSWEWSQESSLTLPRPRSYSNPGSRCIPTKLVVMHLDSNHMTSALVPYPFDLFYITARIHNCFKLLQGSVRTVSLARFVPLLTPFTGQRAIALGRATRGGAPYSTSCVERSDRSEGPVRGTGQTGRRAQRRRSDERSPGRDPVGASACRVALGSAGQIGRPQTPWRREKNSMSRLEK